MLLPDCFDCKYGGGEFPCRKTDGTFDFKKAGAAIIANGRLMAEKVDEDTSQPPEAPEENAWITDCDYEIVQDHPHLVLKLAIAAADTCQTPEDAAYLAAGLLESSMAKHGPNLIAGIEAVAARSAKFRYILSGICSHGGSIDKEVWQRLGRAIGLSGSMDNDHRTPVGDAAAHVLTHAEATELMKERVAPAAVGLPI